MSDLRVFWPEDCQPAVFSKAAGKIRLSAEGAAMVQRTQPVAEFQLSVLDRAKLLRENRRCRVCGHCVTLPLVGEDAELNRSGRPIPGTGTLLGFHCSGCGVEWSV
jgi:hypothetical protein